MFENRNNLLLSRDELSTFIVGLFVEFTFFTYPFPRPQKDPHWKCSRNGMQEHLQKNFDGLQLSKSADILF